VGKNKFRNNSTEMLKFEQRYTLKEEVNLNGYKAIKRSESWLLHSRKLQRNGFQCLRKVRRGNYENAEISYNII
jgi:hypothetical protein